MIFIKANEAPQRFIMSVMGKPLTKKRARVGVGITKKGKPFRWAHTENSWYETYIRAAFRELYPGAKPIGWSLCEDNPNMDEFYWTLKPGVKDVDLPLVELDIIFYFNGGKIGDLDNYLKVVMDALNQYAWIDDRQVHHYKPFIVCDNDFIDAGYDPEPTRVDIYIRPFNVWKNKVLGILRNIFSKKAKVFDKYDEYWEEG